MYQFLNILFFVFHTLLVLFNISGWAWQPLRKWHLLSCILIVFSWFVLGIWKGWGYCVCTDWHWQVRRELGYEDESRSYIHFLVLKLTGINFPAKLVETVTLVVFLVSFLLSIILNLADWRKLR